jgi:hypothetical protein
MISEIRFAVCHGRVRNHKSLPAVLEQYPGTVKLELLWYCLEENDPRLSSIQTGQEAQTLPSPFKHDFWKSC